MKSLVHDYRYCHVWSVGRKKLFAFENLLRFFLYASKLVLVSNSLSSVVLRTPQREAKRAANFIIRAVEHNLARETRYRVPETIITGIE
jgi:hypothetical protein